MSTLIIPSRPTPNGPLHLGHISGPYLRADITKRFLEQNGETTYLASTTDTFDIWMIEAIDKENNIAELNENIRSIKDTFTEFHIIFDYFGDPWNENESSLINEFLKLASKHRLSSEFSWPYNPTLQKFRFGSEISTICAQCNKKILGLICENCGQLTLPTNRPSTPMATKKFFTPYLAANDDHNDGAMAYKSTVNPYIFKELASRLHNSQKAEKFPLFLDVSKKVCSALNLPNYFDRIPLTACTHLVFKAALTEIIFQKFNDRPEKTIGFIGKDGIFGHLILSQILSSVCSLTNFDHFEVNHFLHLEGKKFSTSQKHALWAKDTLTLIDGADMNFWRLYLSSIDLTEEMPNFCLTEAACAYQQWYEPFVKRLTQCKFEPKKHLGIQSNGILRHELKHAEASIHEAMIDKQFNVHHFAQIIIHLAQMALELEPQQLPFFSSRFSRLSSPILTTEIGALN